MWDLFVSYSNKDGRRLADRVKTTLERKRSLRVFVSHRDGPKGGTYDRELRAALDGAQRFLLLWTPHAADSPWVLGEIDHAATLRKEPIVFRTKGTQPLPHALGGVTPYTDEDKLVRHLEFMDWGVEVVVPASGKSSGIYPLNEAMPKILLPIGDKPILHHIVDTLRGGPWSRIHILAGQFENMMRHYINWADPRGVCDIHSTQSPTLSAALMELNLQRPFLLYFSDILIYQKPDWDEFVSAHRQNHKDLGVLGTLMESQMYRLNVGRITPARRDPRLIAKFEEKPEDTGEHLINMAVSIFEPGILKYLRVDDQSLFGDTLPRAIKAGKRFAYYGYEGTWAHIQTLNDWRIEQKRRSSKRARVTAASLPAGVQNGRGRRLTGQLVRPIAQGHRVPPG